MQTIKGIPLVRASSMAPVAAYLKEIGAPVESLWKGAGLRPEALDEPEALIPLNLLVRFIESAARTQAIPDLGYRVVRPTALATLGTFGDLIRRGDTLQEVIATLQIAVNAYNSGASYWLTTEGDVARLCRRIRATGSRFRQADLLSIGLFVSVIRAAAGPEWTPDELDLQSTAASDPRIDVEELAHCRIRTGRAATSIAFPRSLLVRRLRWPGAAPAGEEPGSRAAWLASPPPRDFLASVLVVIDASLGSGRCDLLRVADAAGMSARSFQRAIANSGASFSALLQRARLTRARRLLEDSSVKILDVACELGYSDPAHFTRAFRQWTAISPHAYRELLLRDRGLHRSRASSLSSVGLSA
jgi:AraC-like DNA-binding protein